jgi:DNA-binding SARP family transcriptional activator
LRALAIAEPLNERVHARLMVALAGSGQQAAALQVYNDIRRRLDEQLAVRPCAELTGVHAGVLRQEINLTIKPLGNLRAEHADH